MTKLNLSVFHLRFLRRDQVGSFFGCDKVIEIGF